MPRDTRAPLLLAMLCALACETPGASEPAIAVQPAPAVTAVDPDLADPLAQTLSASASRLAPGWVKVDKLWRGDLRAREPLGFLTVLTYGHCFRFIGAGADSISDFDLVLLAPNGVEVQRDVTQDNAPALGVEASICPGDPGAYRIEARPRTGTGAVAIGLYRDLQ